MSAEKDLFEPVKKKTDDPVDLNSLDNKGLQEYLDVVWDAANSVIPIQSMTIRLGYWMFYLA